jgi:hypothetical protein
MMPPIKKKHVHHEHHCLWRSTRTCKVFAISESSNLPSQPSPRRANITRKKADISCGKISTLGLPTLIVGTRRVIPTSLILMQRPGISSFEKNTHVTVKFDLC